MWGLRGAELDVTDGRSGLCGPVAGRGSEVSGVVLKRGSPSCGMSSGPPRLGGEHERGFLTPLPTKAALRGHSDLRQPIAGPLRRAIDAARWAELAQLIDRDREGTVPLIVPLTPFRHHFDRHPYPWVSELVSLDPHPAELMLRNDV